MAEKPIPVNPGESTNIIRPGGINFASMNSVQDLEAIEMGAPVFHRSYIDRIKASGKVTETSGLDQQPRPLSMQERSERMRKDLDFVNGAQVLINKTSKRVTIIQCNAGHTKKNNIPVHKVANSKGKVWLERETDLSLLL